MSEKSVNKGQIVNNNNNVSSEEGKEKVMKVPFAFKYTLPAGYNYEASCEYGVALSIEKEEDEHYAYVLAFIAGRVRWVPEYFVVPLKALTVRQVAGKKYVVTKQGLLDFNGVMHSEDAVMAPPVHDVPLPTEFMRPSKATIGRRDTIPTPKHPSEMTEAELKAAGWRPRAPKA